MKYNNRLQISTKWRILLVTIVIMISLLCALLFVSCRDLMKDGTTTESLDQAEPTKNGTTTEPLNQVELKFAEFWQVNFGPGKHEIFAASRMLVWEKNDSKLTLVVSPMSVGQEWLNGYQCQTINGRDFFFRDMVISAHGTTRIEGTDIISGKDNIIPYGREIAWKAEPYRYWLHGVPVPYNVDQAMQIASADTAMQFEKNVYHRVQGYSLIQERWKIELYYDDAQVSLIFFPDPFAESELANFVQAENAKPVEADGLTYYLIDKESSDDKILNRSLAWRTDQGLFLLYCTVLYEQSKTEATKQRSFFDYNLAKHITSQLDAKIIPVS